MKRRVQPGSSHKNGFTLIELIVVIAILAVLAAIIVPSLSGYTDKAKVAVLNSNMSGVSELVSIYSIEYDKSDWYDTWNHNGDGSLNNFIEQELEVINNGTYENSINLINPHSDNKSILDYNQTLSSGDGFCPALFLTANGSYAYTGSGSTQNIIGTIVAYFKPSGDTTEYIELYYVNKDGTKSDRRITLN